LITTQLPFRGDDPMQVIFQISQMDQPIDLGPMRAKKVDGALIEIVRRACAKTLADRYPDAEAMENDLAAFLDNRPVSTAGSEAGPETPTGVAAPPLGAAATDPTPAQRGFPWPALLGGVLVLALAGWLLMTRPWEESAAGPVADAEMGAKSATDKDAGNMPASPDAEQDPGQDPVQAAGAGAQQHSSAGPVAMNAETPSGASPPPDAGSEESPSGSTAQADAQVDALLGSARKSFEKARKMPVQSQRAPRLMWEAMQDLQEATQAGPHRADAWFVLGQIEERLYSWPGQEDRTEGFRDNALGHLQQACNLATDPANRTKYCQARDKLQRLLSP
jgi:hypothetical protein